jgi:hypothetical protein
LISVPKKTVDVRFQATIYRIWMMRHVDVPEKICRKLQKQAGTKRHIPVVAIVNGRSVRTTMVPAGGGRYRITLNTTRSSPSLMDAACGLRWFLRAAAAIASP